MNAPNTTCILGSIGEFCAAFYHVPGKNNIRDKCCLDEGNCKVGDTLPRSVAALVKYEIDDGKDIIVRYSNHYIPNATKHAEEFFSDDIKNPTSSSSVSGKTLKKITMYITFEPCHFSTINTPKKSCCDVLLELLRYPLKSVEICIKPTHIYKAGSDEEASKLVKNGEELMAKRIKITRMEEADWNFLHDLVDMNDDQRRRIIPPYSKSKRKALDEETGEFLFDRKIELANSRCSPMHHCLVVNQNDVRQLFYNLFQLCAFFHVFERGAGNASLCLNQSQCPCCINGQEKSNVIVVKGTYQDGGEPYEAKYTDCHSFGIKAEQFLHYDAPGLSDNQRERGIMNGVTIYTTWLPRGFAKTVLPLTVRTLVKVCIKPSHLHGGDVSPKDVAKDVVDLKRN